MDVGLECRKGCQESAWSIPVGSALAAGGVGCQWKLGLRWKLWLMAAAALEPRG